MTLVSIATVNGQAATIQPDVLLALKGGLRGRTLTRDEDGYDTARSIWNGMVDRSPGLIVRCQGASDVIHAVNFAREHDLVVAVRGGGHNIAGNAVCDGGLMIDLSAMNFVRVDPATQRAWIGPGATLGDVDRETQVFGLALPTGINSTTGIAGLTLGGGFGWLTRKYGLTIDSLVSADIVTADGRLLRASADENPDLFWAIRGGGGNFGIVTAFEFNLHRAGPEVLSGLVVHPFDNARELLRSYREAVLNAPEELTCWVVMRKAPPLPFLPAEWHGREVMIFAMCYVGDLAEGERAAREIRSLGQPIVDVVGPHRLVDWQAAFDPLLTTGARNYWKSHDFETLPDEALDTIIQAVHTLPGPECELFIAQIGGAMSRIASDATAYPQRAAHFVMNVHTRWRENRDDSACVKWARDLFKATEPFALGSAYVNFMPEDETDRVEKIYGTNYRRLAEIKGRYDPHNMFRMNQNIRPLQ
ncbi:FAD-binding oxidoreductase [Microvirga sp. 17 mud 1-3]|uniref:FAD-binding oxidoreductase n=1 Tax=Microvirga sp. 17 mud 1-3 TaxID=2082949 RepID=UPI000D6B13CF|nr:FAD-binding oxidoreductase [Microvirga sp. 17 mud 1-3]AWM88658.1 FAD-linked oxidase [Microvirga sp. 17 mud 1-3]